MRQICKFDKSTDLQDVDQFGFVDLVKSSAEGFVPNDVGSSVDNFDGQDIDPESLLGRPSDPFEAIRMQDELAKGIREDAAKQNNNEN